MDIDAMRRAVAVIGQRLTDQNRADGSVVLVERLGTVAIHTTSVSDRQ
jgi:hypothetical protein